MWRERLTTAGHHKIILEIGGTVLHLDCVVVFVYFTHLQNHMPRKFLFMLHKLQAKQQRQKNTGVLQL